MSFPRFDSCMARVRAGFLALAMGVSATVWAGNGAACNAPPMRGFNLIQDRQAPFGSALALTSMQTMRSTGANTVAFVPFLWQRQPTSPDLVRGDDMTDEQLAHGIRAAHRLGLAAIVKPQVWIPGTWAGAVHMDNEADWSTWFSRYEALVMHLAAIAAREHAQGFVIGTELDQTVTHAQWLQLIAHVREVFHGKVSYVAHNVEGAEQVPFWAHLDSVGVTLYPSLGSDDKPDGWKRVMRDTYTRLQTLSAHTGRPVFVAEIGLRSATGAAAKPWESAEERRAPVDETLQYNVLKMWLHVLEPPVVQTVLIWRWISLPDAGGHADTDFTMQGKLAQRMLPSLWGHCQN